MEEESIVEYLFHLVVVVMLVIFGIQLARASRPKGRNRAIDRMIRQARLAVPPEVEAALTERVVARERAMLLGSMAALALSAVPIYLTSDRGLDAWSGFLLVAGTGCGAAIGAFVAEARSAFSPAPDYPRIARSTAPALGDYVSSLERSFTPLYLFFAGAGVVAAGVLMTLNPADSFAPDALLTLLLPGGLLVMAIAAWALGSVAARHLLARGQPATTLTELAWDDALRSSALRTIVTMPGAIALAGSMVTLFIVSNAAAGNGPGTVGNTIVGLVGGGFLLLLMPVLALLFITNMSGRPPHYLRRLWPETAAQIIASPGGYGPIVTRDESDAPGADGSAESEPARTTHPGA